MTVEELSERILDEGTITHYDDQEEAITNQNGSEGRFVVGEDYTFGATGDSDSLENYGVQPTDDSDYLESHGAKPTDDSDSLEHYGVLGMKWGVRKDRTAKVKKRDRRYEGESDQDYQARMNRELQERQAKARYKAEAESQKRVLKSQERQQKLQMKAQERQRAEQRAENIRREEQARKDAIQRRKEEKAAERKRRKEKTDSKPTNTRTLTDRELADAIQRLRSEQEYKKLSLQNKSIATKTLVKTATIGGGILLAVGTAVAKKQLTNVGNEKAEDFLLKKGLLKPKEDNEDKDKSKGKGPSMRDFENLVQTVQEIREKLDL